MYTVSEAVADLLRKSALLEEGLRKGIVNYSSLAREIRPVVSQMVMKEVQTGAIIMALKRYADKMGKTNPAAAVFQSIPDITVRSNIVEYTFANSPTLFSAHFRFFKKTHEDNQANFLIITQGIFETTFIVSETLAPVLQKHFTGERLISTFEKLSAITIKLPEITVTTPGVYGKILRALEWGGINVVEVASTYTEFTIILNDTDIEQAFAIIKKTLA